MKENWELHWKDYYKILQVHTLAETEVIKAAHDKLALKYHPDHNNNIGAEQRMKDINEAFAILYDPQKRATYDIQYHKTYAKPINTPNPPKQQSSPNQQPTSMPTPEAATDVNQLRWCRKCKGYINMRIGFIDKRPTFATCLKCQEIYDIRPIGRGNLKEANNDPQLTIGVQLNLLFIKLSHDKRIKFREREWLEKRDIVGEWLQSKGTATRLGECPKCKFKSVLANSDVSAGKCINPECDYTI
jgi:curved DNA-binding protein CbpA